MLAHTSADLPSGRLGSASRLKDSRTGAPAAPLVLVVDDDHDIRDTLTEALGVEGYSVISAMHGAQALERMRENRPDIVVLDLMMPVMDGPTFIAAKNGDPTLSDIPVLVVTAVARPQLEGATLVMTKPFDLEEFLTAVARHVCVT